MASVLLNAVFTTEQTVYYQRGAWHTPCSGFGWAPLQAWLMGMLCARKLGEKPFSQTTGALKRPSPVCKCFHLSGPRLAKGRILRGLHPLCLRSGTVTGLDVPVLLFVDRNMRLSLGPPKAGRKSVYHPRA